MYGIPKPNTKMKHRAQRPDEILFEENRLTNKNVTAFVGRVFSNRMDKTATVLIPRMRWDRHIKKHFREMKKFKCHDEHNETRIGDVVRVHFDRKRSKTKTFIVSEIIKPNRTGYEPLWPIERAPATISPERALTPQAYLDQDYYRDDVTGMYMPYISDYIMSAEGRGPAPLTPEPLGKTQYHPFDEHTARIKKPIMDILHEANEKAAQIQEKMRIVRESPDGVKLQDGV
jgi:small subunit ribosomal protein S17